MSGLSRDPSDVAGFLHPVLGRQLRRLGAAPDAPPDLDTWVHLLDRVSESYRDADDDRYLLERSMDISTEEMRALNDRMRHQANHDALTGLPNRYALRDALARRAGASDPVAVLFVDLDEFKLVNDTLGHDAGDLLLVLVVARLTSVLRPGDLLARTGGDEFVAACPDLTTDDAAALAERMLAALGRPFDLAGRTVTISASIGVAEARDVDGPDWGVIDADTAMYEAKRSGRSRVLRFDAGMRRRLRDRAALEQQLRAALRDGDGLVLHYQPIVSLTTGRVLRCEALLRWRGPDGALVPPDRFLPVAEQCGLVTALDRWVVAEACRTAAGWPGDVGVTVNMTAADLRLPDTPAVVAGALAAAGLPAARLTVELTESSAMSDDPAVTRAIAGLRRLGVDLAIDDFGTGYSSLSYLIDMPARTLKIDKSFVAGLPATGGASVVVEAVARLAHTLGLSVVVEGVERADQVAVVTALGCDAAQGYHYARPVPAADLPGVVAEIEGRVRRAA